MVQYLHFRILEFPLIGWGFFVQPGPQVLRNDQPEALLGRRPLLCRLTAIRAAACTFNLHSEILWDTLKKRPDSVLAPFKTVFFTAGHGSVLKVRIEELYIYICSLRGEIIRWGVPNFQETQQGSHTAVLIGFSPIDPWNIHGKRLHKQNDAALLGFMPSSVAANAECRLVSQYKRNRSLQEKLCRTEWMQADLNV